MSFFEGLGGETAPKKPFTYELTEFQFANLFRAANKGPVMFAVLDALDNDSEEKRKQIVDEKRQIVELVELGVLEDISRMFAEQITVAKLNGNRPYIVVKLTDQGLTMFHDCKSTRRKN